MKCIGCDADVKSSPAAYAIMSTEDLAARKVKSSLKGPGRFHAAPVCAACFTNPDHRKRKLKAHFAMPDQVGRMLGVAGAAGIG